MNWKRSWPVWLDKEERKLESLESSREPIPDPAAGQSAESRPLGEILSDAKLRAARGEEDGNILAMVKALKGMLHGD